MAWPPSNQFRKELWDVLRGLPPPTVHQVVKNLNWKSDGINFQMAPVTVAGEIADWAIHGYGRRCVQDLIDSLLKEFKEDHPGLNSLAIALASSADEIPEPPEGVPAPSRSPFRGTVYVGRATPDPTGKLYKAALLKNLRGLSFRVLPEGPIARGEFPRDQLRQADLFIQILGDPLSDPDNPPEDADFAFLNEELTQAAAAGVERLRFRPIKTELDPELLRKGWPNYYQQLTTNVEEATVQQAAARIETVAQQVAARRQVGSAAGPRVLLVSSRLDQLLAAEVDELIRTRMHQSVDSLVVLDTLPLADCYRPEHGVMVLFSNGGTTWAEGRMNEVRSLLLSRNIPLRQVRPCALYFDKQSSKSQPPPCPPPFVVIGTDEGDLLDQLFLQRLAAKS